MRRVGGTGGLGSVEDYVDCVGETVADYGAETV